MNLFRFFKQGSENRTQFFTVMGFIVLPVIAMIYVFIEVVLNDPTETSERLRIPTQLLEAQQETRP